MAAQWIHEFVKLAGNEMLPHMPGILSAQLPNMVFDDERRRNMTEDQYKRKFYAHLLVEIPYCKTSKLSQHDSFTKIVIFQP